MDEKDLEFLRWWELHRERERRWMRQLSIGLPVGLVFGLPIILSVVFRGWYKRMPYVSGTQLMLILMACLGIAVFYSIIRMRVRWDQREQRYLELKKLEKSESR